jgi:hypothetical protein
VGFLDSDNVPLPVVHDASKPTIWTANIPSDGDYTVVIFGDGPTNVKIKIPPLQ